MLIVNNSLVVKPSLALDIKQKNNSVIVSHENVQKIFEADDKTLTSLGQICDPSVHLNIPTTDLVTTLKNLIDLGILDYYFYDQDQLVFSILPRALNTSVNKLTDEKPSSSARPYYLSQQGDSIVIGRPGGIYELRCHNYAYLESLFIDDSNKEETEVGSLVKAVLSLLGWQLPSNDEDFYKNWSHEETMFHYLSRDHDDYSYRGPTSHPIKNLTVFDRLFEKSQKEFKFESIEESDNTLDWCLKNRRSNRRRNDHLTSQSLFCLLDKSAQVLYQEEKDDKSYNYCPYPTAGGLNELVLFALLAKPIDKLPAGTYCYDPINHSLHHLISCRQAEVDILNQAALCIGLEQQPTAVIVIASDFEKIATAYQSIAYRLTLVTTGCVLQNIMLNATQLEISVCPTGVGNLYHMEKLIGINDSQLPAMLEIAVP